MYRYLTDRHIQKRLQFDTLYKFGKLKGWEETYPVYKTAVPHAEEQLSTSEAFHIWDHIDPETIKDKFMYRNILSWELTSLDNHVRAIIETIRNDSLRKLWSELLHMDLEYYDKYLKYGKLKGWIRVVPIYGEPMT